MPDQNETPPKTLSPKQRFARAAAAGVMAIALLYISTALDTADISALPPTWSTRTEAHPLLYDVLHQAFSSFFNCSIPLLALSVALWGLTQLGTANVANEQVIQEVLPEAVPGALVAKRRELAQTRFPWKNILLFVGVLPIVSAAFFIAAWLITELSRFIWPQAPDWLGLAITATGLVVAAVALRRRRRSQAEPSEKPAEESASEAKPVRRRPTLGGILFNILSTVLLVGGFLGCAIWLYRVLDRQLVAIGLQDAMARVLVAGLGGLLGTCVLATLALLAGIILVDHWIRAPIRHTDYARAIQRARWAQQLSSNTFSERLGVILFWAGEYDETEDTLKQAVTEGITRNTIQGSSELNNIACGLIGAGKLDEAQELLEGALRINNRQGAIFDTLAEVHLRRGDNPERALELIERALALGTPLMAHLVASDTPSVVQGNYAWALAAVGRYAEADQALEATFALARRGYPREMAGAHYRAGQVKRLQGDREQAQVHFAAGARLDPDGHYGRSIRQAEAAMGSPHDLTTPENLDE